MRSLQGVLTSSALEIVRTSVDLRFVDKSKLKTPEALVVYEQRLLDEEVLLDLCSKEYGFELEVPQISYLPSEVIQHFSAFNCIPIRMDSIAEEIHLAVVPELIDGMRIKTFRNYSNVLHKVPLYYYVEHYTNIYSTPNFLLRIPPIDLFRFVVEEAIRLNAIDITISTTASGAQVFYNVKKSKVYSKRVISKEEVDEIASLISDQAGSPLVEGSRKPKYVSVELDPHNRGRVVINNTYHGRSITIRVLPNEILSTRLEELGHTQRTIDFIKKVFFDSEPGMRVMVGPTLSGKNTTVLSAMLDMLEEDNLKVVSVESPVEQIVSNMIQISSESEEEFMDNVRSLIRQNPDVVYISEMTDMTALSTMEVANTGKILFTSVHANSLAEVISRIQDLTNLASDRILLNLHSAIYQTLSVDSSGNLKPNTRCIYFSPDVKSKLLGKSLGEIYKIIREEERSWSSTSSDS